MTLTDRDEIKEELENSSNNVKILPEDIENHIADKLDEDVEIKELEFDEENGRYTATTTDDLRFQMCAVCGFTQPDNLKAMKKIVPELVKDTKQIYKEEEFTDHNGEFVGTTEEVEDRVEGDLCRWKNARCETQHPPYEPGYLNEA